MYEWYIDKTILRIHATKSRFLKHQSKSLFTYNQAYPCDHHPNRGSAVYFLEINQFYQDLVSIGISINRSLALRLRSWYFVTTIQRLPCLNGVDGLNLFKLKKIRARQYCGKGKGRYIVLSHCNIIMLVSSALRIFKLNQVSYVWLFAFTKRRMQKGITELKMFCLFCVGKSNISSPAYGRHFALNPVMTELGGFDINNVH